ncbi:unnamed protein product, partial [marine sediment metagenome]
QGGSYMHGAGAVRDEQICSPQQSAQLSQVGFTREIDGLISHRSFESFG